MENLQFAQGSVVGTTHISAGKTLIGRNNQDAIAITDGRDYFIATVADGCGSGDHSEVGAAIGSKVLNQIIEEQLIHGYDPRTDRFWKYAKDRLSATLQVMAYAMGGNFKKVVGHYFLFGLMCAIIHKEKVTIVRLGDGALFLKNMFGYHDSIEIQYADNAPPYLAYSWVGSSIAAVIDFDIIYTVDLEEMRQIMIGSDGIKDLQHIHDKFLPGSDDRVGNINQFFSDEAFANPDWCNRRLRKINSQVTRCDPNNPGRLLTYPGLLHDDTSFVVVRRL